MFSLVGPTAQAFPAGQVGHTGNPETGAATCANCHQGSDLPASLSLDAPTSTQVGETITITVTLNGGPGSVGGFNAAAAGGAGNLVAAAAAAQFVQGEVTHTEPQPFAADQVVFSFDWQAPEEPTTVTWYAAGVSGNGDNATSGDAVATGQLTIAVDAAPTPTPTPTTTSSGTAILTPTPTPTQSDVSEATAAAPAATNAGPFGFGLSPQPAEASGTGGADNGLALTGSEVALPAALAVTLFATGAATIVAGRRRQR